ncbi:MAG TPA: hypothetical protein VF657_25870, partial [Actinoplanes sp.]
MGGQWARKTGQRRGGRWRSYIAATATAAVLLPTLAVIPAPADAAVPSPTPTVPAPAPTKVRPFTPSKETAATLARAKAAQTATAEAAKRALREQDRPTTRPGSGISTVSLPTSGTVVSVAPGALPISLSLPQPEGAAATRADGSVPVRVQVFDRARAARAGVFGTLLSITPTARSGSVGAALTVDYAGIANTYGGDFGGRLQLVRLPGCALTTPEKAQCRARTAVRFDNERRAEKLTTAIDLAAAT